MSWSNPAVRIYLNICIGESEPCCGARCEVGDAHGVTECIGALQISDFPEQPRNVLESRNGHVHVRERLFIKDCIPH